MRWAIQRWPIASCATTGTCSCAASSRCWRKPSTSRCDFEPAVEIIRALDTHPGRKYSTERAHYVEPDVMIVKVGDEYIIQLNDDGLPRLQVSKRYRQLLHKWRAEKRQSEAQAFIKEMRSAIWLIKSLDQRQRTIYKVAESIVRQQRFPRPRHRPSQADGPARRGRGHRNARVDGEPRGLQQVHPYAARPPTR